MEYLYVCLFSNGHIKVGRSIAPEARIAQHAQRVACLGVGLDDCRTFVALDAVQAEADLIKACIEAGGTQFQNEWFAGLAYQRVCDIAERLASTDYESRPAAGAFAQRLRSARIAKNMTQADLGTVIGNVSKATVSHWEVSRHEPTLAQFRSICLVLGVRADDLLGMEA